MVLSGANGTGKSNLLEALEQGHLSVEGIDHGPNPRIRLFRLAQLVAVAESMQSSAAYRDNWASLANSIDALIAQFTHPPQRFLAGSDELEQEVRHNFIAGRQITTQALDRLFQESGKSRVIDLTQSDFRRFAPLVVGVRDPFQFSVGELFLTYHERKSRNEMYQWQEATKGKASGTPMSDDEFTNRYGPAPWELLNDTLKLVGLPYVFNHPDGAEDNLNFEALLTDPATGVTIKTEDLSSGEKTLLAVAMSLYTGSRLGEVIELPNLLLLDEADASLHPSMVQSLLRVVKEVLVDTYGVKAILTTHSPTTVALAPEESLYVMRRLENPRIVQATRDEALQSLTVGLATLSVKFENRRQVFVESEYDEECYQEVFRLMRSEISKDVSAQFIASGKGGRGGSSAVEHLVKSLRDAGNKTVFGIVDRDSRTTAPQGILFSSARYSIENFVLDPLVLGTFLLRERLEQPEALGLAAGLRHLDLNSTHAQPIINAIASSVEIAGDDLSPQSVAYRGRFVANIPRWYLETRGHDLEERLVARYPALNRYGLNLKREVITKAMGDMPDFIPADFLKLLEQAVA